ncbi:MAG TPA: nitroreductase family protein [Clostridia bacterium]|nr:nitroreductase family protein [Clostridia bacterium]
MEEIKMRRSIRKYLAKPVENEHILQLLESARLAPSGSNNQPWQFIVVQSEESRRRLTEVAHNQIWMLTAPVFIVCVADIRCRIAGEISLFLTEESPQEELKQIIRDTAISTENLLLEAHHLGLGACWVAWFKQADIRPVLNIPSDKYVCGIITVGYPAETPELHPRKPLESMVRYEKWE